MSGAPKANRFRSTAVLVVSLGLVAVSMGAILVRFSQEAPSLSIAAYRMLFATLLLSPFYLASKRRETGTETGTSSWTGLHVAAGFALALHFAFWVSSLRFTSVAVSVLLVNTSPIFVAGAAHFLRQERLTRKGVAGLTAALCGSFLLGYGDLRALGDWRGAVLALAGAVALGAYLMIGRRIRKTSGLLEYVFPTYATSAAVLLLASVATGSRLTGFRPGTYLFLFLLGLVPQVIGHTSYNWALRFLPSTSVSTLIVGEPVLAALFAWWLLGETLGIRVVPGAVLVVSGILLVSFGGVRVIGPNWNPSQEARNER